MPKEKRRRNSPKVEAVIAEWQKTAAEDTDVLGWYTGKPSKKNDYYPEQDQDDL